MMNNNTKYQVERIQNACSTPKTFHELWRELRMDWNELASLITMMVDGAMLKKNGMGFDAQYKF